MKLKFIYFISLFLLMMVTGVFWGTWFTLTRTIETFSSSEFIHIGKTIIANVAVPMSIIMPLCIVFMFLAVWFYPDKKSGGFYFNVAALILIIITLLITLMVEVPIDNQIKTWTETTVPIAWEFIRMKWQLFHTLRTFTSLASFACLSLAVLKSK